MSSFEMWKTYEIVLYNYIEMMKCLILGIDHGMNEIGKINDGLKK